MGLGLRKALFSDGCKILEGLLNQPGVLGEHTPDGKCHEKHTRKVQCFLGCFELERGYYKTEEGWVFPMDQILGVIGSYTPRPGEWDGYWLGERRLQAFCKREELCLVLPRR